MRTFILLLVITFMGAIANVYSMSPKPLYVYNSLKLHYLDNDGKRCWYADEMPTFVFVENQRQEEFFVPNDTNYRDYFILSLHKYGLDSLFLTKYRNYAGNYEPLDLYLIQEKGQNYLILSAGNLFQMGTDSQPFFIVFKWINNEYVLQSVYHISNVEDNSSRVYNSVTVFIRKKKLRLKGINLVLDREYNLSQD